MMLREELESLAGMKKCAETKKQLLAQQQKLLSQRCEVKTTDKKNCKLKGNRTCKVILSDGMEKKRVPSMDSTLLYIEDDNKNSIWINTFSHLQPSPFHSLPRVPRCKTHKAYNNNKILNALRKISGIPLALMYGFIFTIILKYMILNDLPGKMRLKSTRRNTFGGSNFSCDNVLNNLNTTLNSSTHAQRENDVAETPTPSKNSHVAYISSAFTLSMGITSIFSRGTRCCMLLILPGLITRRSRTFLFTFIMGLLADGPINSLSYNLHQIVENTACIYEAISRISCRNSRQLKNLFIYARDIQKKAYETYKSIIFRSASGLGDNVEIKINVKPTASWPDFSNLVKAPKLSDLKRKIDVIIKAISDCQTYVAVLRKTLTILSILLMIIDAVRYLRSYYSDYSFDNMHIGKGERRLWKEDGYNEVVPIRNWEKNEGYHVSTSRRFSKRDCHRILRSGLPTFLFALFAAILMLGDFLLAEMLRFIINKEELTVFFEGMEHNFSVAQVRLKQFNITTDTCLQRPLYTSVYINIGICFFLLTAILSCVFEIYTSNVRGKICSLFYNQRFQERAVYLHRKITNGRIHRRLQLRLILKNEIERRERLEAFYPWSYLKKFFKCGHKLKNMVCPGCGWNVKISQSLSVCFMFGDRKVNGKICKNCFLDYEEGPS